VTERRKVEAQFLRAQRMESIGTLAGGIAHDLNNVLSPILMAIQMLQLRIAGDEEQQWLDILQANAERGAEMVKQVLSFARGVEGERVALHPKHLVKDVVNILKDTLPKSISITYEVSADLWLISADATQIHQVLMNLCVNARDAMPQGGEVTIRAENLTLDDAYARMHLEAKPGRYVIITVADTGAGMSAEVQARIFEPFFTTKEIGKGTGLGLSTALTIVRSHGGFVSVYSEPRKGTQFAVYLPAIESARAVVAQRQRADLPAGHGELLLVVDDEESIRQITKATLETFNYKVLTASDGTEAVALYAQRRDEIAAVVTDMMMPFMDGPATIRALQRLNPRVKIIAASGLGAQDKAAEATALGVELFLPKPYAAEKLLKALAQVLGADAKE
jgi:nitrogen-specific signal transduction histidine kinase/CheY-like chemotaxis protein